MQLIKKETLAGVFFSVNFAKFQKTPFLQNTSGRLLLVHLRKELGKFATGFLGAKIVYYGSKQTIMDD